MDTAKLGLTSDETLASYDKLECEVLASNCKKFAFEFEKCPELLTALCSGDPHDA
jgi:hypothetical protein